MTPAGTDQAEDPATSGASEAAEAVPASDGTKSDHLVNLRFGITCDYGC